MSTTPPGIRGVFDLPPGPRIPASATYQGLEYPGEVVLAPAWQPALGEPLQGECFFRIVFLQSHVSMDIRELQDARIVVCLPPRRDRQRERTQEIEQRVLKELRARYGVPESEIALRENQRQLYAAGTLVTHAGLDIRAQEIFQDPLPESWASAMGRALLAWAYPRLPLDTSAFPRPLGVQDIGLLFRGLVQGDTAPETVSLAESFGPGLGLTPGPTSEERGVQEHPVFQIFQREMARRDGSWPCAELYQQMAHVYGIPYPLVSLYLLVFVHRAKLPVELHLRPGHGLRLRDGQPYPGRAVLAETVSALDPPSRLDAESLLVRYATPVSWATISLYFSALEPSLASEEQVEEQRLALQLMDTLKTLQADVQQMQRGLERLGGALGEESPQATVDLLTRFYRLGRARTAEDALQRARQQFGSPQGLAQAISRYRALRQVASVSALLIATASYVRDAHVPEEHRDLAMQRQALQAMLRMSELTSAPFSVPTLQAQIERFREDYQQAYASYHEAYRRTVAALLSRLREASADADALGRLNTLSELGEPVERESLEQVQSLIATVSPCPRPPNRLSLSRAPLCRSCGVVLGQRPPSQEIASIVQGIQRGLKEQSRQLSMLVVQRVLRGPIDSRMARFIRMVEASNVSGLVQVLDDQIVAFLREVLKEP